MGAVLAIQSWFGWSITGQALLGGTVVGLGYAVIAAGLVLIYRSSGIVNVAQASMGAFGVNIFILLFNDYDIPYPLAMLVGIGGAVVAGVITELLVIRRLFNSSRVVLLIATVGVAQLIALLIIEALPDVDPGPFPVAFDAGWAEFSISDRVNVGARETSVLVLLIPALVVLGLFLTRTRFGLHIRAVADSPENSQLVGVSPRRVSTIVWGLAAGFAAFTQVVTAPLSIRTSNELASISVIGLLLRVLVIALAARMRSIPLVVVAGVVLGCVERLLIVNHTSTFGLFDLVLLVLVLVLVLLRTRGSDKGDVPLTIAVTRPDVPDYLRTVWWIRHINALGIGVALVGLALVPVIIDKPSSLETWSNVVLMAAAALSLSLLTGWAGQLSLGQFAFLGVGGLTTLALHRGHRIGIGTPWTGQWFDFTAHLPWLVALLIGTAMGVIFAVLIGLPALRVRGLFLAVTTLAFAGMASNYMFLQSGWNGGSATVISAQGERPVLGGLEFRSPRMYFLLCLIFLVGAVIVVSRLRRTGPGRKLIAVRDNERMTAAANVSPARAKLSAFAVSGGLAAMTGGFLVYLVNGFNASGTEPLFDVSQSLRLVAVAIIGGIGSVGGAVLGALFVFGLPAALGASDAVKLLTANLGLLILLLYFPGGLIGIVYNVRDVFLRWYADRAGITFDTAAVRVAAVPTRHPDRALPVGGAPWLRTTEVSVSFGGVRAVDNVTIEVHQGELVGLIGTNGAGKSTLMDAVSGFVPSTGQIEVLGVEVSHLPAHRRHALGLGRGFQDASLFPGLTVRETVLVALEAREASWLVPSLFHLPPSPGSERRKRAEAGEIIGYLGLSSFADAQVAELSTGTRRIVELACLLATEARVLLLDEPTGGVAQKETEAFAPLIKQVQRELDAAIIVIEHDMPLIMTISDRVYCLEAGAVIAEGTPEQVRNDPLVIASYLGTDDRAIVRSNQPAS